MKVDAAAADFLSRKRIAVTGVSRDPKGHGSNIVYRRFKERGYEVYAINPNAGEVEGDRAYPDLSSVPERIEAVVIGTSPGYAMGTMEECVDLGIDRVWMHRAFGQGSVSDPATEYGRSHGITVIDGGCPCMFGETSDGGHKVMKWMFSLTGKVPREV